MYIFGWVKWIWNYYILRKEYTEKDSEYLTIKALKIPTAQWHVINHNIKEFTRTIKKEID